MGEVRPARERRSVSVALLGAGAISFLVAGVVAAGPATADKGGSSGAPPGNNATVKINNIPFDNNVNNEPHVTCPFLVTFYNFDSGTGVNNHAVVTFTAQPPSGNFQSVPTDAANSDPQTFDFPGPGAQKTYTFTAATLATLTEQPQQGYHLKLNVDVTSTGASHGNSDHPKVTKKFKVFWLTCAPTTQPSESSSSSAPASNPASSSAPASAPVVQPTQSQTEQVTPTPSPSTTVLGEKVTRKPPKSHVKATKVTKLPFTGVSSAMFGVYIPAAFGFIFTGAGLVGMTRRTKVRPQV